MEIKKQIEELKLMVAPLLEWYEQNARELPWRSNPLPYRVWVSEIMLQQTRVEAVKPYYARFMEALPDVYALGSAPEELLLKLWEGMGYYSRVRNMQKAAKIIVQDMGGQLPSEAEQLKKLPGIGEYTAAAISSIAFGRPYPVVDGNVLRVVSRWRASLADISAPRTKKDMQSMLAKIIPKERPGDFNQAVMELGAVVCLPNGEPLCEKCPVANLCRAHREGLTGEIPVKSPKKSRRVEHKTVLLLQRSSGEIAVVRRPSTGLLAGLWEFPSFYGKISEVEIENDLKEMGLKVKDMRPAGEARHIFTHIVWEMLGFAVRVEGEGPAKWRWVDQETLFEELALPSAFRVYRDYLKKQEK